MSARLHVRTGDDVLIGGFIVSGNSDKSIIIRALGPSLADLGVKRILSDPDLELYDSTGKLIDENDNWTSLPPDTVPLALQPTRAAESVIVTTLPPGSYSAVLRSVDGTPGNALCELYDLSPGDSTMLNMSTRGEVGVGDDVMIGGFIVGGEKPTKVMIRALGPSLSAFGISGVLQDPILELHNSDGSTIFENDDWQAGQKKQILASKIAPSSNKESAVIANLGPGNYTAIVRGANDSTGVAMVEVYNLSPP
ncbi:MAG: hypothetical protein H0U76_07385 [Ktedonobacteraceae bacterium]|nr:hypothetical protein [Ktedonobacteraceae bacterium]